MRKVLEKAKEEIGAYRHEIISKLCEFARTDMLFFWSDKAELFDVQQKEWQPILDWAADALKTNLDKTKTLDVPDNTSMIAPLIKVVEAMNNEELSCFYAAALNMRSVLLALALIKGRINAEEAFRLSYLEELWQNEKWGTEAEAVCRRDRRLAELKEIESFLTE